MLLLLATLGLFGQTAAPEVESVSAPVGTIFSTVGHSEWCPAGEVKVDLSTGKYEFTPRAKRRVCNKRKVKRPVAKGSLEASRLEAIRTVFQRARSEGLDACAGGLNPQGIVVSNGGKRRLVLTTDAGTSTAPDEFSCWSDAANALHTVLEDTFRSSNPL